MSFHEVLDSFLVFKTVKILLFCTVWLYQTARDDKKGKDVYCLIYRTIILWFSIFPLSGSLAISL